MAAHKAAKNFSSDRMVGATLGLGEEEYVGRVAQAVLRITTQQAEADGTNPFPKVSGIVVAGAFRVRMAHDRKRSDAFPEYLAAY